MTPIKSLIACLPAVFVVTFLAGAAFADTLTVTKTGGGSGTVTSNVGAISCPGTCTDTYVGGTSITLTAMPAAGSQFTGWLGPCTGSGTCQFTINGPTTVAATFASTTIGAPRLDIDGVAGCDALTDGLLVIRHLSGLSGAQLITGVVGQGAARATDPQIGGYLTDVHPVLDIDGNGQADAYTDGLLIMRYMFGLRGASLTAGAVGSGATRTTPDIATQMQNLCLPATALYTLSVAAFGYGTVTSSPAGINCGADCNENYNSGTVVTLTATSSANSVFSGWGGACTGTATPCAVAMDAARSVSANFTLTTTSFFVPYAADGSLPPSPTSGKLALSTQLQKADVGFIVDTTGSMGGEITNLKATLSTSIIPALQARIPSLGVGVAGHDDFPLSPFGTTGDLPFYLPANGFVTTNSVESQTAVNALTLHNGNDLPESQVPAVFHALTGSGLTWTGGSIAAVTPPAGTFGAMHFRSDAFPIVINITDASHHNGKRALDKTGTNYDSAIQFAYSFSTWTVDNVVTTMNSIGAKFIGVAADNGTRAMGTSDPYGYHAYITDKTNSNVPPSAFTSGTCITGVSGATVAVDGPTIAGVQQCRSVFSMNTNGTGLSTAVVNGVVAVLNTVKFDVYVQAYSDAGESIDVVNSFIQKVEPDPAGGTDPLTGGVCISFPVAQLADRFTGPKALVEAPDGIADTITQVNPGPLYCFKVTPMANSVVAPTAYEQSFRAWLRVVAVKPGGTFVLGADRAIVFIVPPSGS